MAFDRLALDDPTALDLLTVVAWCGPEPAPLSLLTEHPDALPDQLQPIATDPLVLARCTAILHRRGMATTVQASLYQQLRGHLAALTLHTAAEQLPAVLDRAAAEKLSLTAALERLLALEVQATQARRLAGRLRFASLPCRCPKFSACS